MIKTMASIMEKDLEYGDPADKDVFHKTGMRRLRAFAQTHLGLSKGQFDVRSNRGGIAVSGEVTLHTDRIYIQLSKGFSGPGILIRTCGGRRNFSGHSNNTVPVSYLDDPEQLQDAVHVLVSNKFGTDIRGESLDCGGPGI